MSALVKRAVGSLKPVWTKANEVALGVRTEPRDGPEGSQLLGRSPWRGEVLDGASHDDNFHYATIDYWNARRVLRFLKPGADDVFFDIGSGQGRILCVFARKRLRKCVGVELSPALCETARRNAARLRGKKTPVEIVCADSTRADLSGGTIYFMFNPFGPETLRDTLENIKGSLKKNWRQVRILYYNAEYEHVLEATAWLQKLAQFESWGGLKVTLWANACTAGVDPVPADSTNAAR